MLYMFRAYFAHYNNLNRKIDALQHKQQKKTKHGRDTRAQRFYPRTVNLTNIKFTSEEMTLLNN
jgi:hypothetical protein